MIIICINLPRSRQRARRIRRDWSHLGHLIFLPATRAEDCEPEPSIRGNGHLLVAGEVACRTSHNRAIRLVDQIGQTCCVIEDDARPLPNFRWPENFTTGRLQLEAHGSINQYGSVAQLIAPGCPEIPPGYASDWWPKGYPVRKHDPLIVDHAEPDTTTIHGRLYNHRHGGKQLILGLGCGGCGTSALTELLNRAGVACTHEMLGHPHHQRIAWDEPERAANAVGAILLRQNDSRTVGDVAHWWLPHFPYLKSLHPNLKAIALRHDPDQSPPRLPGGHNHWDKQRDPWTNRFPKFTGIGKNTPAATQKYADYYYRTCRELEIEIFDTSDLTTATGIQKILRHLNLDLPTNTTPEPVPEKIPAPPTKPATQRRSRSRRTRQTR